MIFGAMRIKADAAIDILWQSAYGTEQCRAGDTGGAMLRGSAAARSIVSSRRRALIMGVAIATSLLVVAPVSSAVAASATGATVSGGVVPMAVETAIDTLGTESFPDIYGDIAVINDRTQIAVYLTTLAPSVEAAFEAQAPPGVLVFRWTPHSLRALDETTDELRARWSELIATGINVVEFGPNILIGKEDVGVQDLTSEEAEYLDDQFGEDMLNLYSMTASQAAEGEPLVTRIDDTAPYNGGDAITNRIFGCTSGFGIKIDGNGRLITAGHCFYPDDDVVNARCVGTDTDFACQRLDGGLAPMGRVTQSGLGNNNCDCDGDYLDSEVVTGCDGNGTCGGSDLLFTGALGNPQIATVAGKGSWHVGDQVCESGAYGGEKCGYVVEQVNYCRHFDQNTTYYCHLTRTLNADLPVHGDSGGPVYRFSGSSLYLVGTVTARIVSSDNFYFTGINAMLDKFGLAW